MSSRGSSGSKTGASRSESRSTPVKSPAAASNKVPRPSAKLDPKTIDPFGSSAKQKQSPFASVYSSGGIPCRLVHGSVKHKITWSIPPDEIMFDPLLVTIAEGIRETVHPYSFVARTAFEELLNQPDAGDKASPLLARLMPPLRAALSHQEGSVFEAGLKALGQLSDVVGPALNQHLKIVLVSVAKRSLDRKYKEKVHDFLVQLESNGGKDAVPVIKSKVPTYLSISR